MTRLLFLLFNSFQVLLVSAQTNQPVPGIKLKVKDKSGQFLRFYDSASRQNLPEPQRWALWKNMYDFAAVPPTPQGDSMARALLNAAWPAYAKNLRLIKKGAAVVTPGAEKMLSEITALLRPDSLLDLTLLAYVGGFEGNAFNTARGKKVTLAVAIETPQPKRTVILAHELTHAVHIGMGSMSGDWNRAIGAIAISEGLALHVSKKILPKTSNAEITEHVPGWFAQAEGKRVAILKGLLPFIHSNDPNDIMRFTMGTGPSGLQREAYYAGWLVVDYLLKQGMRFSAIARIPENEMPQKAKEAIEAMLKSTSHD
jgi:hypothetical protein